MRINNIFSKDEGAAAAKRGYQMLDSHHESYGEMI